MWISAMTVYSAGGPESGEKIDMERLRRQSRWLLIGVSESVSESGDGRLRVCRPESRGNQAFMACLHSICSTVNAAGYNFKCSLAASCTWCSLAAPARPEHIQNFAKFFTTPLVVHSNSWLRRVWPRIVTLCAPPRPRGDVMATSSRDQVEIEIGTKLRHWHWQLQPLIVQANRVHLSESP